MPKVLLIIDPNPRKVYQSQAFNFKEQLYEENTDQLFQKFER